MNTLFIYNISAIVSVYCTSFLLLLISNIFISLSEQCLNKKSNLKINEEKNIFTYVNKYMLDSCRSFKDNFYYNGLLRITFEVSYDLFIIIFLEI